MNIKKLSVYFVIAVTIIFLIVQNTGQKELVPGVKTIVPSVSPSIAKTTLIKSNSTDCFEPNKSSRAFAVGITHYQYPEAKSSDLVRIGNQRLHKAAAKAFTTMQKAAYKEEKIKLTVISGFRSISEQTSIVNAKRNKGMDDKTIYSASSEPGFSEHHTGFAMDINSLEPSFAKTKEGKWLKDNVSRFGFEISFPETRPNGVSYEPWHIRYVLANPKLFCWGSQLINK